MPYSGVWVACLALLVLRAMVAAAESALYGISELKAQELAMRDGRRGQRLLTHKRDRETTTAAFRMSMTLTGFFAAGIGALGAPTVLEGSHLGILGWINVSAPVVGILGVALTAAVLDVSARALANAAAELWALRLSSFISLVVVAFSPLAKALLAAENLLLKPFGAKVRYEPPPPPLEELEKLLAVQAANHEVDQSAPELIRSIFELSDKRCKDVMVPRTEVVGVDITTPPNEILQLLAEENHSRIPVYRDDIDHIVGVLHARDLIPFLQNPELLVLEDVIRPAHFVPWIKPAGDLLRDMQKQRIHMAMVVDEYGGFMGVVTLEDILREIVGDIADEFEVEEHLFEKQADGAYLVDAAVELEDFQKALGFPLPEGEYETLGGYLSSVAGSIPDVGDKFTYAGWQFTVQSKEGARLERIRLSRVKPLGAVAPAPTSKEKEKDLRPV